MNARLYKRLTALLLAFLLCLMLPSCSLVSTVKGALVDLTDKPSDFDRYVEYLRDLNEDHEDMYHVFGYTAMAYPVQVQDETCLNLAGIMNAKGGNIDKFFTLTVVLIIPEGGQNAHFAFSFSEINEDDTQTELVRGTGTFHTAEYNGSLPSFTDYTNNLNDVDDGEEHYREMATEEMNRLLAAAEELLARADLTLDALGFTYTPEEPETSQTVSYRIFPDRELCL